MPCPYVRLIVGTRQCRVLISGNVNSDATGIDIINLIELTTFVESCLTIVLLIRKKVEFWQIFLAGESRSPQIPNLQQTDNPKLKLAVLLTSVAGSIALAA